MEFASSGRQRFQCEGEDPADCSCGGCPVQHIGCSGPEGHCAEEEAQVLARAPGPVQGEECPGCTTWWPAAEEEKVGRFSIGHAAKLRASGERRSLVTRGRRRQRSGEKLAARKRRQAEAAPPRDVEPLPQKGELHRGREETWQHRVGEDGGRGSAGAGHVLGRTWPEQDGCLKDYSPIRKTLKKQ
ncbi:hypothetical protein NDU88_005050 [Pleurodeles waltl]|uniref:Uncharacterized protein n=1 Tax=Pleurodeles waltl TaxID=8319 RepID=A0AAV7MFS2_PLEWA|nr:hypothetical protein NDU88_005050 [Pleurodeles waltl]